MGQEKPILAGSLQQHIALFAASAEASPHSVETAGTGCQSSAQLPVFRIAGLLQTAPTSATFQGSVNVLMPATR